MIDPGLHVYIGTTGTGKTHKAIRDALELAGANRQGLLVIDSRGAENLREIPEFRPGPDLWEAVFGRGAVCRVVPKDDLDFDSVIRVCDQTGHLVILIDECAPWANNKTFQNLCRVWRHRKVSLFITTQKVGRDIEQTILACDPRLYIFRLTAPRSIEWAERWHHLTPEQLRALPTGAYFFRTF